LYKYDYPSPNSNGYIDLSRAGIATQFAAAQTVRQQLAKDLYQTFISVTGAWDPNLYTVVTLPSNGVALTPATIDVGSTVGFPSSGTININMGGGVLIPVTYTGTNAKQFTGCTGGMIGMLATGQVVTNAAITPTSAQFMAARWLAH